VVRRLLLCFAGLILALHAAAADSPRIAPPPGPGAVLRLDSAEALLQPEGLPERHQSVLLQHRWDKVFPGRGGRARYTLALPPPAQPGLPEAGARALLIDRIANQAVLRVNGTVVQQYGTLGDGASDAGRFSQLVVVPAVVLRDDGQADWLTIELSMQPLRAGGLSAIHYGPLPAIEALQARHRLWDLEASAAYAASLLLMGGLALGLWWRQRDALYGCFGLAALLGAVRHLDHVWLASPLPWPFWGAVLAVSYGCHLALIARFVVLALGLQQRWLKRALNVLLAATAAGASLSFWLLQPAWWTAALVLMVVAGVGCFALVLREAVVARRPIAWLLLSAGGVLLASGVNDLLRVRMGLLGGSDFPLTPHAMFLFVLMLAGLVVTRYSRTVSDYLRLNASLAERIAEREAQLKDAFESLRAHQQEQAVLGERQRIMREIHDGIGSQLVGLLGMVEQPRLDRGELGAQVRLALDEMRMAVDSLQPVHNDLTTVLATLRYRLQSRLAAAGIGVVWEVAALPPLAQLPPQSILQLQRMLLEAFTNVLKHAHATRVTVQAEWLSGPPARVRLRLVDDGVGLPADDGAEGMPRRGHGLNNMRTRAARIGATLQVGPAAGGRGTCVMIEIAADGLALPASTDAALPQPLPLPVAAGSRAVDPAADGPGAPVLVVPAPAGSGAA